MRDDVGSTRPQPPLPPSPPVPPCASAEPVAAANTFANDGNFMAQFLAQQQHTTSSSSCSKPATSQVEEAVVTAAERDTHVKESVLKNDGSFMATFLALQHKEERLAKQQLLSTPSADTKADVVEPSSAPASAPRKSASASKAAEKASGEPPKKKRSRWDAGPAAGDVGPSTVATSSKGKMKAARFGKDADEEAKAVALLVESGTGDTNDALIRAKQQKHVAELRFLEQRIRGFQQQMQLSNGTVAQSQAQANEQLSEERRAEYARLAALLEEEKAYKDSVEDAELGAIQDGTLEHRRRAREMLETLQNADTLTRRGEGKHHLGDFLPQAELDKFMREAKSAVSGGDALVQSEQAALVSSGATGRTAVSSGSGLGYEAPASGQQQQDDDEFDQYRKRMMLAYRFRPNPLNNPRRPYS